MKNSVILILVLFLLAVVLIFGLSGPTTMTSHSGEQNFGSPFSLLFFNFSSLSSEDYARTHTHVLDNIEARGEFNDEVKTDDLLFYREYNMLVPFGDLMGLVCVQSNGKTNQVIVYFHLENNPSFKTLEQMFSRVEADLSGVFGSRWNNKSNQFTYLLNQKNLTVRLSGGEQEGYVGVFMSAEK